METVIMPEDLVAELPLERGDRVLVASDVTTLCWEAIQHGKKFDLNRLIDLMQEKLGPEGTLLFPTYNWDFCHGKAFDYRKTRSRTGALGQTALGRKDFRRTQHALYSFAVWGKDADLLVAMKDANSFAGDTPFDYFYKFHAKMIILDVVPAHSFTFVHYVEEMHGVDYRFKKNFTGRYIDEDGAASERTYQMFVRYLDGPKATVDHPRQSEWLIESGAIDERLLGDITIGVSDFAKAYGIIEKELGECQGAHLIAYVNKGEIDEGK